MEDTKIEADIQADTGIYTSRENSPLLERPALAVPHKPPSAHNRFDDPPKKTHLKIKRNAT